MAHRIFSFIDRFKQTLMYASLLRANGHVLNETAFNNRKTNLTRKNVGILREKVMQMR